MDLVLQLPPLLAYLVLQLTTTQPQVVILVLHVIRDVLDAQMLLMLLAQHAVMVIIILLPLNLALPAQLDVLLVLVLAFANHALMDIYIVHLLIHALPVLPDAKLALMPQVQPNAQHA